MQEAELSKLGVSNAVMHYEVGWDNMLSSSWKQVRARTFGSAENVAFSLKVLNSAVAEHVRGAVGVDVEGATCHPTCSVCQEIVG